MKYIKTILCLFVSAVLFAGCVLLDEPILNGNGNRNTNTKVKINIGNKARTILPSFNWEFSKYVLGAEPIWDNDQDPPDSVTIEGFNDWGIIYIPLGNWKITVTAYITRDGNDYAVSNGFVNLSVWDKNEKEVVIHLNFPESGGTGTFTYNISYPGDYAYINLTEFSTGTNVFDSTPQSGENVSRSVPSGMYWLWVDTIIDEKKIIRQEIVHIYDQLETYAKYNFIQYAPYEPCPYLSNLSSSNYYEVVNLMEEYRYDVLRVWIDPEEDVWAAALYDLSAYKNVPITIRFSADVKREGTGTLKWEINNGDYPSVGEPIINAREGIWHHMSGTWTGIPTDNAPFLFLSTYENNSDQRTYLIDDFTVEILESGFDVDVGLKGLTVNEPGFISVDTATGIISRGVNSGSGDYGNSFSVQIPSSQLPIIPSDKIVISYIADDNVLVTPKLPNTFTDLVPVDYPTLIGDGTVHTYEINAVAYGASIPTAPDSAVITFQGRPNTTAWRLKITDITVVHGDPIQISLAIPTIIKTPTTGGTPVTTFETLQYTGAVSWSPNNNTFVGGTIYTATITLTKKTGYTFEGIVANSFTVSSATSVTNAAGGSGNTMTVTAVFPAASVVAPDKTLTFNGNVIGYNATITPDNPTGFTVTNIEGYQGAYPYFAVTFDGSYKLSDYTKIDLDVTTINEDSGYKPIRIAAYNSVPNEPLNVGNVNIIAAIENGNPIGAVGEKHHLTLNITSIPAGADLNTVYIAICIHADSGDQYKIENIKFYN